MGTWVYLLDESCGHYQEWTGHLLGAGSMVVCDRCTDRGGWASTRRIVDVLRTHVPILPGGGD